MSDALKLLDEYEPVDVSDFSIFTALIMNAAVKHQYGKDFLQESYLERFSGFLQTKVKLENVGSEIPLEPIKCFR